MELFDNPHWLVDSQDGAGLEVFLIHPFGLAYLQDLCVAQVLQATLELVQGIRLECQRSHDLLPHHLHYLQRKEKNWVSSSHMPGCGETVKAVRKPELTPCLFLVGQRSI